MSGQRLCTTVRTVSADDNKPVDPMLVADFRALKLPLFRPELMTARRTQNRAAALDRIRHRPLFHVYNLFIQEPLIPLFDPLDLDPVSDSLSDHCADRRIHARRITSAGQHTDCFDLLRHSDTQTFLPKERIFSARPQAKSLCPYFTLSIQNFQYPVRRMPVPLVFSRARPSAYSPKCPCCERSEVLPKQSHHFHVSLTESILQSADQGCFR